MRVLVLSPRFPFPPDRGDKLRVHHLVAALRKRADVRVLCFGHEPSTGEVRVVRRSPTRALRANLATPDPRLPLQVRLYLDAGFRAALREQLADWRPDVVHATLARMAPYLREVHGPHRHLDFVDALSLNMRLRADASALPAQAVFRAEARMMRAYEQRCAAFADSASLVAEADRDAAGIDAAVIPNGVDLGAFEFREPRRRPPTLLFFGNLGYFPNVQAARFIALEVLPRIRRTIPEARLRLAGMRPAASVRQLGGAVGVEVVGPVPDMAAELHGAAVAIIPMLTGTGMKNKVLEAFAAGTPVVANAMGIAGVDGARPGVHYGAGEGPGELAQAAVELMREPPLRMAGAARRLVEERFSWDSQAERLLELYGAR